MREALATLRAEHSGTVAADRWQAFLAETRLADRTKGSEEPALGTLLAGRRAVSLAELAICLATLVLSSSPRVAK